MKIAVLSLFPEMFDSFLSASILGRARAEGLLDVRPVDIRPYSDKKHKNTDDYPFGGGAGMVMLAMVLEAIGLPVDYIGLIVAVDRLFDMGRTCLNVTGDIACSICVTKWESGKKAMARK